MLSKLVCECKSKENNLILKDKSNIDNYDTYSNFFKIRI